VIFPPTYARPERTREEDWLGYNIEHFEDGSSVCQIDSVGSQTNRMEPVFKRKPYSELVPDIVIKAAGRDVHLLDAGHRAADAIVRFSDLREDLKRAFNAIKAGDAAPMAKIAPTSLVFGAWDSRDTQVKVPRIVRSVIRAFDVRRQHRSALYVPAIDYVGEGLIEAPRSKTEQDSMSQLGLRHAPATWTHGGIQVLGEIRRDAAVNLVALRALGAGKGGDDRDAKTLELRRYVLGLALVCFTAPQETSLREGCQLIPDADHPAEWHLVRHDGKREPFGLSHAEALSYA
jgi:CRISPR-associated protein Csb1